MAQCGDCQTGQIMATVALLASKPNPTEADVALSCARWYEGDVPGPVENAASVVS